MISNKPSFLGDGKTQEIFDNQLKLIIQIKKDRNH